MKTHNLFLVNNIDSNKIIFIYNPSEDISEQLSLEFFKYGFIPSTFKNVNDLTYELYRYNVLNYKVDCVIVPKSTKINKIPIKQYLNNIYPNLNIKETNSTINESINYSTFNYNQLVCTKKRQKDRKEYLKNPEIKFYKVISTLKRNKYKLYNHNYLFITRYNYLFEGLFSSKTKIEKNYYWEELKIHAHAYNYKLSLNRIISLWKEYKNA